ncbi:MAG TPA: 3-phosphoshikimate 1-carboxyvinyltransferase [Clostridiales bacterium]|nr:3-phosphoshikimate 1-carboxyvinyltransferase [Clostridiales bacterium]
MRVKFKKSKAHGTLAVPPSKSMAHRLLLAAALGEGACTVHGISDCEDVAATLDCIRALGLDFLREGACVTVYGKGKRALCPTAPLPCRESGSTLRFLIPLALLSSEEVTFTGAKSLFSRPLSVYETLAEERGLLFSRGEDSLTVRGPLTAGDFSVVGNISSQFISGLLFALPLLGGNSRIRITTAIESRSYIEMTLRALAMFGVRVMWQDDHTLFIPGGQVYRAENVTVEGDYSGAAFPAALNLFGSEVTLTGLSADTVQGDSAYLRYYPMLAAGVPTLYIGDCPDLGPILFAVAAAKNGGVFDGTRRLKIKESDRAAAMAEELKKFGTSVSVYPDTVVIYPTAFHAPAVPLEGHGDHRIVMALSILLSLTGGEIRGAEAVRKSYPAFFDDLSKLGIIFEVQDDEN